MGIVVVIEILSGRICNWVLEASRIEPAMRYNKPSQGINLSLAF